ncbi:hypothetical protein MY10362_005862 [Beauveria mimosiformis]
MLAADTNGPRDWAKEEDRLYDLLIQYRKGLKMKNPEIPRSPSLNTVAQTHANNPFFGTRGSTCNPHSWPAKKEAKYKSCCFNLADSKAHPCMWDKPRELTTYQGNGFEVYYGGDPSVYTIKNTAEECLKALQKSAPHNDVLTNKGPWTTKWQAVGVGMANGQCAIWFGHEKDTATMPDSQTAQDGPVTPSAQEQQPDTQTAQDGLETPGAQEQQPDTQTAQDDLETPGAQEQQPDTQTAQDDLETPGAQEQQPDTQTAQDDLETPGVQEQQVGHEEPDCPDSNPNPTPTPTPDADLTPDNDSRVAAIWTQCGGKTWTGPTVCAEGLVCKNMGKWYSQCKPAA